MSDPAVKVDINIKEIYKGCCPRCRKKLEALVRAKMETALVKRTLEDG